MPSALPGFLHRVEASVCFLMPRRAFDDDSFLYSEILAQHTSVAIAGDKAVEEFHRALANRDVIGQAKGIIMERFGIDAGQAI
jgi:hypothetical protein